MISSQVKNRLQLKSKSMPIEDNHPRITTADLCASNSPFSTVSAKLNVVEKPDKKAMSSTLPTLPTTQKSGRALKNSCVSTHRSNSDSHGSTDVRMSVSAGHEKLKIAIAKSMPRPIPNKEKSAVRKKLSLPSKKDDGSGSETSDCESSPSSVNVKGSLTEADLRQIAIERSNRAVQKQRQLANAERRQAEMERQNRADMIEQKLKQRKRHRAEVYAVNAILKKLEMSKFDEIREERGADRSFLNDCSTDDETSVEDNTEADTNDEGSTPKAGVKADKTARSTGGRAAAKGAGRGKDAKVPAGPRSKHPSTRKLHISSEKKVKVKSSHCDGIASLEVSLEGVSASSSAPPPSTSESEVCNFSFGV